VGDGCALGVTAADNDGLGAFCGGEVVILSGFLDAGWISSTGSHVSGHAGAVFNAFDCKGVEDFSEFGDEFAADDLALGLVLIWELRALRDMRICASRRNSIVSAYKLALTKLADSVVPRTQMNVTSLQAPEDNSVAFWRFSIIPETSVAGAAAAKAAERRSGTKYFILNE
jgi:hypothetical protein